MYAGASGQIHAAGKICGAATVTNTDLIKAVDQTGTHVYLVLSLVNVALAPGAAADPGR